MKTLEKGQDKIKKICDVLRRETLEPAKHEAEDIIKEARLRADEIVAEGERQAQKLIEEARLAMEQERNVFHSSLTQASKQSLEALKQNIEAKLFNETLQESLAKHSSDPKVIAELINAIVKSVETEGLSKDLSAIIPQNVSSEAVSRYLARDVLEKLKNHGLALGSFTGGAQVKLLDKKLTLDISDKAITDFLKTYVRKDFRKLIFSNHG